jgi:hypothetical protein
MGVWIKTDGQQVEVRPNDGKEFSLAEMQHFVGGYIELVRLRDGRRMFIDEEGKLKQKPVNVIATAMYVRDIIVGDALVVEDGEVS